MSSRQPGIPHGADLRAFRWPLRPLERKLDQALEAARLAAAACYARQRSQDEIVAHWKTRQAEEHRLATDCLRRDPRLVTHVLAYLAGLERRIRMESDAAVVVGIRVAAARELCARRQRELACVQALRDRAQHAHAQEQLRRAQKEADADWLARSARARAHAPEREAD